MKAFRLKRFFYLSSIFLLLVLSSHLGIAHADSPTGSILINNGAGSTNFSFVNLSLSASDNGSSVTQMLVSNDASFTSATWEPFVTNKIWNLTSGEGPKTLYVQFKDALGNTSETYSASISVTPIDEIADAGATGTGIIQSNGLFLVDYAHHYGDPGLTYSSGAIYGQRSASWTTSTIDIGQIQSVVIVPQTIATQDLTISYQIRYKSNATDSWSNWQPLTQDPITLEFFQLQANIISSYSSQVSQISKFDIAVFANADFAVRITSPFSNFSTSDYSTTVQGTIIGRDGVEVGVNVNGILAAVNGNSFVLADLPLTAGQNTITAFATDVNGMMASDSIIVNVLNPVASPLSITASPSSGPAPLTVTFSIDSAGINATLYRLDYEGDGTIDASASTIDGLNSYLTHTYATNGLYYPTVYVTDNTGKVYKKSMVINVVTLPDFVGKWNAMRNALSAGDVNTAVSYFSLTSRDSYMANLNTIEQMVPQGLQIIAADTASLQIYETGEYYALGEFTITRNGNNISFAVHFVKDEDGVWRIEEF